MNSILRSFSTKPLLGRAVRLTTAAGLAGFFVLASTGIASAHVHVEASSTAAEGSTQLSFRVPTESETASTTTVSVALPKEAPFVDVSVQSLPGWTATVGTAKLPSPVTVNGTELTKAPSTVTWTANSKADRIAPEQYQDFTITAGPLPKTGTTLLFPVTQTYSDSKVVKWDQVTPAGGDEPENPAPTLTTTAALPGQHDDDDDDAMPAASPAAPAATTTTAAAAGESGDPGDTGDPAARWLGGAGLALGVIALGLTVLRGRSSSKSKA